MHIPTERSEITAILASTGETMHIEKAHLMTGYHNEEQTPKIVLELGWSFKKGWMIPQEACSVGKAKQFVINKHVHISKKAARAGKKYF